VEDDPMVAHLNKRYLEKINGYALSNIVRSADEALTMLDKGNIDLILLDIFMPGMNGFDLLYQIRQSSKGIDVILVTAANDKQSIEKALRYGVVDYLIKPFEFERFRTALTGYRKRVCFMKNQDQANQDQLDQHIFVKEQQPVSDDLPKGLDRNTLKTIWKGIQEFDENSFSTEEIAEYVGISRVSMRKYLDFLSRLGVLSLAINYGSIGRPVSKYKYKNTEEYLMKRYLI